MQADHIPLSIEDQGDVAVFSDCHLGPLNVPAGTRNAAFLNGAVITLEINNGGIAARRTSVSGGCQVEVAGGPLRDAREQPGRKRGPWKRARARSPTGSGARPLARSLRRLGTGAAGAFNRRRGHLLQTRDASRLLEEAPDFLELRCDLHLHPIRTGIVQERGPRWGGSPADPGSTTASRSAQDGLSGQTNSRPDSPRSPSLLTATCGALLSTCLPDSLNNTLQSWSP